MERMMKLGALGLGLQALLATTPALAAAVSVTGGITRYAGPTWDHVYAGAVTTTVTTKIQRAGAAPGNVPLLQPLPGESTDLFTNAGIGLGELDLTNGGLLAPAASIEFWQSFDDSKDAVNAIAFAAAPAANVTVGQEFLVGTFTFTNGGWFGSMPLSDGSTYVYPESAFSFVLTTQSADAALNGHSFLGTLRLHVTGTTDPDPIFDADYFYIAECPACGYIGVYESYNAPTGEDNAGSIDFYARIGSLLPTRFDNPVGSVLASAIPVAPVPLPAPLGLLVGGLGLLAAQQRKRLPRG